MRRLPLLFCYILVTITSFAQNSVPNGNFETYTSCPNNHDQALLCSGWFKCNNSSPDYYNVCGSGNAAVPVNLFGVQAPVSGQGYMGLINGAGNAIVGGAQSEYVGHGIFTLQVGITYEVSMSVSLADNSTYACDGLGVYFYRTPNATISTGPALLSATPQVSFSSYGAITDTAGWTRVVNTFDPDSAYDNLVIGGYKSTSLTGFINAWGNNTYAYYYIDSVVVQVKNHLNVGMKDTFLCLGDSVQITAYADSVYFSPTNTFTFQLSDANGSFTTPFILGSAVSRKTVTMKFPVPATATSGSLYRVRVISNNPVVTSDINKFNITIGPNTMPKPVSSGNSPVCMGDTLSLSATNVAANASVSWDGPAGFNSTQKNTKLKILSTNASGQYIITSLFHGCRARDTFNVVASNAVYPLLTTKTITICEGDTLNLVANSGSAPATYSWTGPGSFSSTLQNPKITVTTNALSGLYPVSATIGSCVTKDTVTANIKVTPVRPIVQSNSPVCAGDTIKLTGSTTTPGVSYKWTGPASFNNTTQNPKINIAAATNAGYYVLTVTLNACTSKDSTNLAILQSAYPILTTKTITVCEKDTIKLASNTGPAGTIYSWTGPLSFTSTLQNPFIANSLTTQAGRYIVAGKLNTCITKDSVTVTVNPTPVKPVANSNTPVCVGDQIQLTGSTTTTGVTYSWTGPSYTSSLQNPNINNASSGNAGNYILSAKLGVCISRDTETVVVNSLPVKPVAAYADPACEKDTLKLSVPNKVTGTSYSWAGPNSFSATSPDVILTPLQLSATGSYIVTANLNGCYAADTTSVTVKPAPAKPVATSNAPVCSGKTLNLYGADATSGVTYSWAGPGSYFSPSQNPVISPVALSHAGTYILAADLNGCKQRDTINVIIKNTPAAPVVNSNSPVCIGGILNLTAAPVANGIFSWVGPSFVSTAQNPVRNLMIPPYAGNYSATVTVDGCTSSSASTSVTVTQGPTVSIYPNPNDTVCAGNGVAFGAVPTNGGSAPQYQWYKNGNLVSGANKNNFQVPTVTDKDSFFVTMLATGTACNTPIASNQITMTVLPTVQGPSVSITVDPDTSVWAGLQLKFTASPAGCKGNVTYQWYGNGKPIKDANTNPWLANHLSDGTVITCVVKCHDWCPVPDTAVSNKLNMHVSTGIENMNNDGSARFVVYPNPNNGKFTLSSNMLLRSSCRIEVVTTLGQVVFSEDYTPVNGLLNRELDLRTLSGGLYLIKVNTGYMIWSSRFNIDH